MLAGFSLTMIACAYLVFQLAHNRSAGELARAILLAAAFLFWAANQFGPHLPEAPLFNDIAIGLFVLDVFLEIAGRPPAANTNFPDGCCGTGAHRCGCGCSEANVRTEARVANGDAGRRFGRD